MPHAKLIACHDMDAGKLPPPCGEGWGGGLRISPYRLSFSKTHP